MVLSRAWTRLLFLPQPYREFLIDTISPVNLPVLLHTKRVVGRQVGSYQHQCDWACNLIARLMNHQCRKLTILGLRLIHMHLCQLVRRSGGWMDGRVGATAEKEKKGFKHTWGERVHWKFLTSLTPLLWPWLPPGSSFSSAAVFSQKMEVGEFSFWFILMHCPESFIGVSADSQSRSHMPSLTMGKTSAAQI